MGMGGGQGMAILADGHWIESGFVAGRTITFDAPGSVNAGSYRILEVSADGSVLTLEGDIVDESGVAFSAVAGANAGMITVYGGQNDDIIVGSIEGDHIAGGSGDDIVFGQGGIDHIYGDDGFNVDLIGDVEPLRRFDIVLDPSDPIGEAAARILAGPVLTVPNVNRSSFAVADGLQVGDDELHGGDDDDIIFGDHGVILTQPEALADFEARLDALPPLKIRTTAYDYVDADGLLQSYILTIESAVRDTGGDDMIFGDADEDILIGGANRLGATRGGDDIDGGTEEDFIFGDNVRLDHRPTSTAVRDQDPRMRQLIGTFLYNSDGSDNTDPNTPFADPRIDGANWATFRIVDLDHSFALEARADGSFGDDYIAGGADEDLIFGQLGDDVIQGDGSILGKVDAGVAVGAARNPDGTLAHTPSFENQATDGDDYVEGGGGDDVIFGNLGQDDLIGGNSSLFSLVTPDLRPDGSDIIFGGAGLRIDRNALGQGADSTLDVLAEHAFDADVIMGDNANIYGLIDSQDQFPGDFLEYALDATNDIGSDPAAPFEGQSRGDLRIVVRAYALLDYTAGDATAGIGGSDLIKAEDGDDIVHGMIGDDVIYGDGWDDDLIGGVGADKIFGGSGTDGIIGDDGFVKTSRNGVAEPLSGLPGEQQKVLTTPGGGPPSSPSTAAVVDIAGVIKKAVDLQAFESGGTDIIYGGLGDDYLHGGADNDAISGAEALAEFFDDTRAIAAAPFLYDPLTRKLDFFDADNPREMIQGFLLNFETFDANGVLIEDGKDWIFGDYGHDALFGGTGHDRLFGGIGDDYHQLDDNLATSGTDDGRLWQTTGGAGDFAFGGVGLDVLIANTGYDRMFDWTGEFNSFFTPFRRFGEPTVIRAPSPQNLQFQLDMAAAGGADLTLGPNPFDESGTVGPQDPLFNEQHGPPRDPQPGNGPDAYDDHGGPENDLLQAPLQDAHSSTPTGRLRPDLPGATGLISIEKAINAVDPTSPTDAEDADNYENRVFLDVGTPVVWTYLVRNLTSGARAVDLGDVTITDTSPRGGQFTLTQPISGDNNGNGLLDPNETWLFSTAGVVSYSVQEGLYTNIAFVTATDEAGGPVSAWDANNHEGFGVASQGVRIEKAINALDPANPTAAEDADSAPGMQIAVGASVVWTYNVFNTGTTPLSITSILDDFGTPGDASDDFAPAHVAAPGRINVGDIDNDGMLDPNEVWRFTSTGVVDYAAAPGVYANIATVAAENAALGVFVSDSDANHHFGMVEDPMSAIRVDKAINAVDPQNPTAAEDADLPTGPTLSAGDAVVWTYLVSNDGDVAFQIDMLVDDFGTADLSDDFAPVAVTAGGFNVGDANANGFVDPGEAWLFTSAGVRAYAAVEGQYVNSVTVTATDVLGGQIADSDLNHHVGAPPPVPGLTLEKLITADGLAAPVDADTPDGPMLAVGTPVVWLYEVGNVTDADGGAGFAIALGALTDDAGTADPSDDFAPVAITANGFNVGDGNANGLIDVGETWLFTSEGAAAYVVQEGLYTNRAVATGMAADDPTITLLADDPNNHFGVVVEGSLVIEKAINATDPLNPTSLEDADVGPGPELMLGTTPVWTYLVRNQGLLPLGDVVVTDDAGTADPADDFLPASVVGGNGFNIGDANADGMLDPGETWLYSSAGVSGYQVTVGAYVNKATAVGTTTGGFQATAEDLNHHFGFQDGNQGSEGNTPGFWKNNADMHGASAWPHDADGVLIYDPADTLESLFDVPDALGYDDLPLVDALDLNGGQANALLRHAVAAVLNATHPDVAYPLTAAEIIAAVNDVLANGSNGQINALKDLLDGYNNAGSDLSQNPLTASGPTVQNAATLTLDDATAEAFVDAAASRFGDADVGGIVLSVSDLPGDLLAVAVGDNIIVDIDAAGRGWFVDATPEDDAEFAPDGETSSLAAVDPAAAAGVDLLTVVMHELGHVRGLDHADGDGDLMSATLGSGVRLIPDSAAPILLPAPPEELRAAVEPQSTIQSNIVAWLDGAWLRTLDDAEFALPDQIEDDDDSDFESGTFDPETGEFTPLFGEEDAPWAFV